MRSLPAGFCFLAQRHKARSPHDPRFAAIGRRPAKFSFARLAAAMISVVLPMNFQSQPEPARRRTPGSTRSLALPSLSYPAFQRNHAPFMAATALARIIPIIRSG
jgi:hypothetical protein